MISALLHTFIKVMHHFDHLFLQVSPRDVVATDVVAALEMCAPSISTDDLTRYSKFNSSPRC